MCKETNEKNNKEQKGGTILQKSELNCNWILGTGRLTLHQAWRLPRQDCSVSSAKALPQHLL